MAEINNVIAEASQDLQTIEDFVNLPAGSDVRPRLLPSVNVGTLAGTRDAIFKAGGLPAEPFATKALMTASSLANGKYAVVTDDTVNNGLYVKTAGAWVKSEYDPLTQAKTYTDAAKSEAITGSKKYTDDEILKFANKSSGTFDTLALLIASTLANDSYALVANDPDLTKNGHYKKVSGAWTKVLYDPVAQAKAYTDTVKSETISTANYNALSLTSTIEDSLRELKNRLGVYETSNLFNPNQASAIGRYSSGEPSDGDRYIAGLEFMKIEAGVPFWSSVGGGGLMFALYDVNKNYLGSVSTNDGVNGVYPIPKLIDNKIPYFLRASTLGSSIVNIQVGVGAIRPPSNLAYKESYKTIINQEFMGEIAQDSIIKAAIETIATQVHNTPAPSTVNMLLKQL